jgi:hypothetical protein
MVSFASARSFFNKFSSRCSDRSLASMSAILLLSGLSEAANADDSRVAAITISASLCLAASRSCTFRFSNSCRSASTWGTTCPVDVGVVNNSSQHRAHLFRGRVPCLLHAFQSDSASQRKLAVIREQPVPNTTTVRQCTYSSSSRLRRSCVNSAFCD